MEALLLVGGSGSRMKSIKKNLPKCLLEINNKPFLFWSIKFLMLNNVTKIILCSNKKDDLIKETVNNLHFAKSKLFFSEEIEKLGTGGAIRQAIEFVTSDNFVLMNGDVLFDIAIKKLLAKHNKESNDLTYALLKHSNENIQYGRININEDNEVLNYKYEHTKPNHKYIDSGLRILNKKTIIEYFKTNKKNTLSFEDEIVPWLIKNKKVKAKLFNTELYDIGNPKSYEKSKLKFEKLEKKL